MSAFAPIAQWTRPARHRAIVADLLTGMPLVTAFAVAVWRLYGEGVGIAAALIGLALLGTIATLRARRFDTAWLVRRSNALRGDFEDSAELLFAAPASLGALQQLQQRRLLGRLSDALGPELSPAWPRARIAIGWAIGVPLLLLALFLGGHAQATLAPSREGLPVIPGVPRLVAQHLRIVPPAYTGLPVRDEDRLDARAPAGSRLEWTFRFAPAPRTAAIELAGGGAFALRPQGDVWTAERPLAASILYRVVPAGAPPLPAPPLHRIEAVPDTPPRIRIVAPERTLNPVSPGQSRWTLKFAVSDDYGVVPAAQLRITVAAGAGENVTFREHVSRLVGLGSAREKTYSASLDLAQLGFTGPGDLVAQLTVSDNRSLGPQVVRSPSIILRRLPADEAQGSGLDAMARKVLPAYFASERQIIIDAEALIKQRRTLDSEHFLAKSDSIGADQASLRMRYGQFMGQENEGHHDLPVADDAKPKANPNADLPVADDDDHHPAAPSPTFGNEGNVTAQYGHVHDSAEAATLLDTGTKATLKIALDAMWDAERRLRTGDPQGALPFANKALVAIKKVQQATRIFLGRVGTEQAPIDMARRMTGKRDGLADRDIPLGTIPPEDRTVAATWAALGGDGSVSLRPLEAWLRANPGRVGDPLALAAAIDPVRRDPSCAECRRHLRAMLWQVLPRPVPAPALRAPVDAVGRRYLDSLGR
jgi:hypothetical protein